MSWVKQGAGLLPAVQLRDVPAPHKGSAVQRRRHCLPEGTSEVFGEGMQGAPSLSDLHPGVPCS